MTSPTPHQQQHHQVANVNGSSEKRASADSPTMESTTSTKRGGGLKMRPLAVKMPSLRNVRSVGNLDMIASTLSGGSSGSRSGGLSKPVLRKHKSVSTGLQSTSSSQRNFDWKSSNKPQLSSGDLRILTRPTLRGCLSSGSNHSAGSIGSTRSDKMKRSVSFSKIQVREYERTMGDNVVSSGVPVSLGWNSTKLGDMDVDAYEEHKQPRSREEMLLPSHVRMEMTKHLGFSLKERMEAAKASNIERNRRVRSKAKTQEMDKMDYALEKASRTITKFRRKISPMNVTKKTKGKPRSRSMGSGADGAAVAAADFEIDELIRLDRLRTKQMQELRRCQSDPMIDLADSSSDDDEENEFAQASPTSQQNGSQQFRRNSASDPNLFTTSLMLDDEDEDEDKHNTKGEDEDDQEESPMFGKAPVKRRSLLVDDSDADRHREHFDSSEFNLSDHSNLDFETATTNEEENEQETNKESQEKVKVEVNVDNCRIKEDNQPATQVNQHEC